MHQNQWMAAIEDMGGMEAAMPIPNCHPIEEENEEYGYVFLGFQKDGSEPATGRWSSGTSIDGKGEFTMRHMEPEGEEPVLGPARPNSGAQVEQL